MHITQKTYVSFSMPTDYDELCKFEQQNDLTNAKKYEDTISVTYEFVQHWQTERSEPQTDCPYREYPCDVCDMQTECAWK